MRRRWTSFDRETTNREFEAIPPQDRASLFAAMRRYRDHDQSGWVLKAYGDGLMMLKAANRSQGRTLFLTMVESEGEELLVALLAYKKETKEAPARVIETARSRMTRYRKG